MENCLNRVLVVDDNIAILDTVSELLSLSGFEVVKASDGSKALQAIKDYRFFDIVITDFRCKKVDGNRIAEHLRKAWENHIKIIAMTSDRTGLNQDLFDFILDKPFSFEEMLAALHSVCIAENVKKEFEGLNRKGKMLH